MRIVSIVGFFSCAWLSAVSCVFVHDTDCQSNTDCKAGRVCQQGTCVAAVGGGVDTGGGDGPTGGGTTGGAGSSSTTPSGPSCYMLRSGSLQPALGQFSKACPPSKSSVPVQIGSGGLVTSVDGRTCTLKMPGVSCYDIFPDKYQCGECEFDVHGSSINGGAPTAWYISTSSCSTAACGSAYCCTSEGIRSANTYWFAQTGSAPSTTTGTGGGSSCGEPCSAGCCSPSGRICCKPPVCGGDCAGSSCC